MYSYFPFILLATSNFLLIVRLNLMKNSFINHQDHGFGLRKKNMNLTVILLTSLFIVVTIPSTINTLFYPLLIQSDVGLGILYLFDSIANTYHCLNIVILLASNKKFFEETLKVFFIDRVPFSHD